MRIINNTVESVAINDLHRGISTSESDGIYEGWTAKSQSVVPGNSYIDLMDTEDVMLSYEMGNLKTYIANGVLETLHSITGRKIEPFKVISGTNDTFIVEIDGSGDQTFTLPSGEITIDQVVSTINSSCSGFVAEKSMMFFRSSNQDDVLPGEVDGELGNGMGQRTEGIVAGFLTLVGDSGIQKIEIKDGTANSLLGFNEGDFTKVG